MRGHFSPKAQRAEVDPGELPLAIVVAYGDVRGTELPSFGRPRWRPLGVHADGDRDGAVVADGDLLPVQFGGDEVAAAVAVEPLLLGEDEAERADQVSRPRRARRAAVVALLSAAAQRRPSSRWRC